MSAIFGLLHRNKINSREDLVISCLNSMNHYTNGAPRIWINEYIAFGHQILHTTPESVNEVLPYFDSKTKCCINADARIDYREELINKLDKPSLSNANCADSLLILESYYKWGKECLCHLYGDFVFAIWDPKAGELFCARDQMGCRPLYYHIGVDSFIFSNDIKAFHPIKTADMIVRDDWILESMTNMGSNNSNSPFKGINRLEAAHYLTISLNDFKKTQYWNLEELLSNKQDNKNEISCFKDAFTNAVLERTRSIRNIGSELSGGLDSSGVSAFTSKYCAKLGINHYVLSHNLPKNTEKQDFPFQDESFYSDLLCKRLKIDKNINVTGYNKGAIHAVFDHLLLFKAPISEGFSMMSDLLYKKAFENDIGVLISGYGGDQGVSSQANWILYEYARTNKWKRLRNELKNISRLQNLSPGISMLKLFVKSKYPAAEDFLRYFAFKRDILSKKFNSCAINSVLERRYALKTRFLKYEKQRNQDNGLMNSINSLHNYHFQLRLESSYAAAISKGIEYRYPLLDLKLLKAYMGLPMSQKFQNGIGRYAFRQAIKNVVPEEITWRNDKSGTTIPNFQHRFKVDIEIYKGIILDAEVNNSFHYVDYKKLLRLLEQILLRDYRSNTNATPNMFFNHLKILILQKWQREGIIDIGIKV
ncbi:MAG: asparagine synthase-related protein [Bacteroidota bacterium]